MYAHINLTKPKSSENTCGKCFKTENDTLLSIPLGYIFYPTASDSLEREYSLILSDRALNLFGESKLGC